MTCKPVPPGKHTKPEDVIMTKVETTDDDGDVVKIEGELME